ncbi:hypothetical protein B0H11DRAFT_2089649 [Mycena galericulata]|nr:hypothetical protein B0H11DRAFT_2089649 [Mycena galericulata]
MFGWCGFVGGGTAGLKAKMGRWQSLIGREWHGRSGSCLGHWSLVEWLLEGLDWLLVALWVAVASGSRVHGSQYIGWQVPLICRTGVERRSVGWMGWLVVGLVCRDVGLVDGRWALLPTLGRLAGGLRECSAQTIRDFWVGRRPHVRCSGVCWGFTLCVG